MNDDVAAILATIVARYGEAVATDPARVEALLRDLAPGSRREVAVLVAAVRAGVPAELAAARGTPAADLLPGRLATRLGDDLGLAPGPAAWAVATWTRALGPAPAMAPVAVAAPAPAISRLPIFRLRQPRSSSFQGPGWVGLAGGSVFVAFALWSIVQSPPNSVRPAAIVSAAPSAVALASPVTTRKRLSLEASGMHTP